MHTMNIPPPTAINTNAELIQALQDTPYSRFITSLSVAKYDKDDYYDAIIKHADSILLDIANTNQTVVGTRLGLPQNRMSTLSLLLKAHIRAIGHHHECH